MSCCTTSDILLHYTGESKVYYCDLGEAIRGRTITGLTSVVSSDSGLAISSTAILTADTSDYDQHGNAITIEASTGVRWTMSAGTPGTGQTDSTATLTITFTTSAGTEQAVVRVNVVNT
jgi:hypothetical protein